jgi:hypothetical protein
VDGFFSLTPRECDAVQSLFYTTTNASYPGLENFLGVSQSTAPTNLFAWRAHPDFLPLITAGQKPVFLDDTNALSALTRTDFDGGKIVFLPPAARAFVTISNATDARVTEIRFGTQTVDAEITAAEPALVVVAQTYYHNWRAFVDGRPAVLLRANVAFQAVQIPAGQHQIRLVYQDRAFATGAVVSGTAWLGCLVGLLFLRPRCVK